MDPDNLRAVPLFAEMAPHDLKVIAAFASEDSVPAGATLMREGDYSNDLLAIETGTADVVQGDRTVAHLGPGDIVGEAGVLARTCATRRWWRRLPCASSASRRGRSSASRRRRASGSPSWSEAASRPRPPTAVDWRPHPNTCSSCSRGKCGRGVAPSLPPRIGSLAPDLHKAGRLRTGASGPRRVT